MVRLDRQSTFSGTTDVNPNLAIDRAKLGNWLRQSIDDPSGVERISQFKGGQSNPTYLVETAKAKYVLRRKPPGHLLPSAHAIDREYRVMAALGAHGFPAPNVRGLETDPEVLGSAFYVMDFVPGRVFWDPEAPGLTTKDRAALFDNLNETLARLHNFDPSDLGLGDFGKAEGYVSRQIARWSKQYRASETNQISAMDQLIDWLPAQVPPQTRNTLVHGDFRLDNCIIHPDEPRVIAVLDWELSTLGDPLADFTYHLCQWEMPISEDGSGVGSLLGLDLEGLGIPDIKTYTQLYGIRSGQLATADLDFYFAYNFFRLAAIFQGITGRVRDGTATNANAAGVEGQVRPLAEKALIHARRAQEKSKGTRE